ncbi:type IV pilus assembly protein PilM [Patescibacteria group bacterium]|nr:type IV pilus assembly protein PilM [Patescibacteria group bacterium]MBU4600470.1 type IV pilus assembly protein PilM [Patescibacteria group bacterium]MCG2698066.1 type IV pilus assembly protein PilM [Candidatus Parcubacteria bacterium]
MFFNNNSTYPIGLDISDLSLKFVQLNKIRNKITIQAMGKTSLPAGLIEGGEIKNKEEVAKKIKKLIANPQFGKISSGEIISCLPETKTFIKLIEVERTPNPMREIISNEIEKHIPMPINEMYYDWQIIKTPDSKQSVLIGAAPQNIVSQYANLLKEAKYSIVALEIEPISICRSLLAEEALKFEGAFEKNYGIIDIGAKRTSMIIYSKNTILFTVSMPISGEEATNRIARTLKIEASQAEKAKIVCGFDERKADGIIKNILSDMAHELIKKMRETIEFYNAHFSGRGPINEILLCGGGANIKKLDEIISKELSIPAKPGNALINLSEINGKFSDILKEKHILEIDLNKESKNKKNKLLSITQDASLTFSTAIGLALRGIFIEEI